MERSEPDYMDIDTDRYGYCKHCERETVIVKRDIGIGRYEYQGAKGVHIDLRDHCADCQEEL